MEDLELIKDAFADDPEVLLDELGIEYQVRGGRLGVLCPFHSDRHIGNAIINNGHFRCFACGASGDCFSLVQQELGYSFPDAVKYCAQVYSITSSVVTEDISIVKLRLNKQEQEALMFPKTSISLSRVLKTDKEAYKSIVCQQADKMMHVYQDIISNFGKRDAEKAYIICRLVENWTPNTYVEITRESESRIQVLKDLKRRILR